MDLSIVEGFVVPLAPRNSSVLATVGLTLLGAGVAVASQWSSPAPARAAVLPAVLSPAQSAAVEAQAQANTKDREATKAMIRWSAQQAAEAEAQRQAAAAAAAAAQAALANAVANPRAVGQQLVAQHGWGNDQFSCLDKLWTKESNWTYTADNPSSSAYGIPQSLPGNKMAIAGADWQTNPATQIRWGLMYISNTYGTPCQAWSHSQSYNWY